MCLCNAILRQNIFCEINQFFKKRATTKNFQRITLALVEIISIRGKKCKYNKTMPICFFIVFLGDFFVTTYKYWTNINKFSSVKFSNSYIQYMQ